MRWPRISQSTRRRMPSLSNTGAPELEGLTTACADDAIAILLPGPRKPFPHAGHVWLGFVAFGLAVALRQKGARATTASKILLTLGTLGCSLMSVCALTFQHPACSCFVRARVWLLTCKIIEANSDSSD